MPSEPTVLSPRSVGVSDAFCGAFQAVGRLLFICTADRHYLLEDVDDAEELNKGWPKVNSRMSAHQAVLAIAEGFRAVALPPQVQQSPRSQARARSRLLELAEGGPYFFVGSLLDPVSLCCTDAACRSLRDLNQACRGPWHELGLQDFKGLELDGEGAFEERGSVDTVRLNGQRLALTNWKERYISFRAEVPTFRAPFQGNEITDVFQADEIAYLRCRLLSDMLGPGPFQASIYLEVAVLANPDNVSLAVVNFEAGGRSSVTFSPSTGAVIRERKVNEEPRRVEGEYVQPLPIATPLGSGFEGFIGLYLHQGHLAFFRKSVSRSGDSMEPAVGSWECTGFVTDLSWAEGRQLTPCLAFRNEGAYRVRVTRVGSCSPPVRPERNAMAYEGASWNSLDWDASQEFAPEE
jgi:hypothetical protein